MAPPSPALVFVYNADRGVFNTLADVAHKVFSPSTYQCNLCAITHGTLGMRKEWKAYLEQLNRPIEFLHRDELRERHGVKDVALPAIFLKHQEGQLEPWIDAETLNGLKSLGELKTLITSRL